MADSLAVRLLTNSRLGRRQFLRQASSLAAGATLWSGSDRWARRSAAADDAAKPLVTGKDARLIVHSNEPVELETPLALLAEHKITPKQLLFVRNNQGLDGALTLDPINAPDWSIDIAGLVEFPRSISVAELSKMEQTSVELVLQCSGNGRAFFSQAAPAKGSQWQCGALGNVVFEGVPLRVLLDKLKTNVSDHARFLTAEGKDRPLMAEAADFEHSIPLDEALDKSFVAIKLNGEPIPAVHGGPARLITPGYYGTMNVKWLSRLRLEGEETANHHQVKRYRTPLSALKPGAKFDYARNNSEPNWRMRIKSVIFAPLDGAKLAAGEVAVRGVAWNDGVTKIVAVEVSADEGQTWRRANMEPPASPYAWHFWSANVKLPAGQQRLSVRAIDALGRTQPLDNGAGWNPAGYAFNSAHTIEVTVS